MFSLVFICQESNKKLFEFIFRLVSIYSYSDFRCPSSENASVYKRHHLKRSFLFKHRISYLFFFFFVYLFMNFQIQITFIVKAFFLKALKLYFYQLFKGVGVFKTVREEVKGVEIFLKEARKF